MGHGYYLYPYRRKLALPVCRHRSVFRYRGCLVDEPPPDGNLGVFGIRAVAATAPAVWNSVFFATSLTTDGPFLVGIPQDWRTACSGVTTIPSTCMGVALGSGTNLGYGDNAMRVFMASSSATVGYGYSSIASQNAFIRLNGYVPVELMRLDVE